jgi:hypothetical protein
MYATYTICRNVHHAKLKPKQTSMSMGTAGKGQTRSNLLNWDYVYEKAPFQMIIIGHVTKSEKARFDISICQGRS